MAASASAPVLIGRPTAGELSDQLLSVTWRQRSWGWTLAFAITGAGTLLLIYCMWVTVTQGIGTWGNNIPVGWALGIVNFVWWIGIGHAGTFISAILLLLGLRWRTSINRFAEAMTLFAVVQAGLFPLLHLGRPWFAYWLVPYPATMSTWPNFKSALPWDAVAIFTYFTVSLFFWYLGLIPDLAALRDRAPTRRRRIIYGIFALGWRGSGRDWSRYRVAYWILAALATPLVISVHTVVSFDFATTIEAGWHSTIFPPFFVAGAILSGFAMVLTLMIPVRRVYRLHGVITERHLDGMAKVLLITSLIVSYAYIVEHFIGWYSGDHFERFEFLYERPLGPYAVMFWMQIFCNALAPQILWWKRARVTPWLLFVLAILINVGMWIERFEIVVVSLHRDYLPSSWAMYLPTRIDLGILLGTLCFFGLLFLTFLRLVPFVPVAEVQELRAELDAEEQP